MKRLLPLLLPLYVFSSCNIDSKDTSKAVNEIGNEVEKLTKTITNDVQQTEAPEELKKLQQWEYQIFTLPAATPPAELQGRLNDLGKERWECFHAEKLTSMDGPVELLMMCKRRPYTPLKYLPRQFVGG